MISQWILEKIEPLKSEKLIIVKDPQRMIRRGELVVDGWGEEHSFTVLLCTGNLYLRNYYEQLRGGKGTKVLLVDRTRQKAEIHLFYPDIDASVKEKCRITLTLQDFLTQKTGELWPPLVNDRILSRIIMDNLSGILAAHDDFRSKSKTGFTDEDLYKIILGGVLNINPFKKLTPKDVRRVCIEQHSRIEELKELLPEEAMDSLLEGIRKSRNLFSKFLNGDPHEIIRAFTCAAILHQHGKNYESLLGKIDPTLKEHKDISPQFLNEALNDQLEADPDKILADVGIVEEYLKENPDKLAFLLDEILNISDEAKAFHVLKSEKLSPLTRSMALLSLIMSLLEKRESSNLKEVLSLFDEESSDTRSPALRRPSDEWRSLRTAYIKACEIINLLQEVKKCAKTLLVVPASQLKFETFEIIWNKKKVNRLEYYLSELERLLRVGDMLPIPRNDFWPGLEERWDKARERFRELSLEIEKYENQIETKFQEFLLSHYPQLLVKNDSAIIFTHEFLHRIVKHHWDPSLDKKAVILIFDGLRADAWEEFLKPVFEERFEVAATYPGSAILPTETHISRKALCAGKLPVNFTTNDEKKLIESWYAQTYGDTIKLETIKNDDTISSGMTARFTSNHFELVIFNFSDRNLHNNEQDLAFLYDTVIREIIRQDVRSALRELPDDAVLFITSDHGFTRVSPDTVTVAHRYTTDKSDVTFRTARTKSPIKGDEGKNVFCMDASTLGIPVQLQSQFSGHYTFSHLVFPRPGYSLSRPGAGGHKDKYSHGGVSMAECFIPMVVMKKRETVKKPIQIEKMEVRGAFQEDHELEIIVTLAAPKEIEGEVPVTLELTQEDSKPRVEVFTGKAEEYKIHWIPKAEKPGEESDESGVILKSISVVATYQYKGKSYRVSRSTDIKIRMDTTRVRRKLNSKLDMLMGKIPKGL